MANKKNEEEDLLTLGEARKEIEQEEVHNKKQVVPVIMMIVGFLLMIVGIFYNDIIAFINPKEEKTTVKSNYEDVKNKLECMKEDEDETTVSFLHVLPSMDLLKKHSIERLSSETEFFMSVIIYNCQ